MNWDKLLSLYDKFETLHIKDMIDYEKFYIYSVIAHSTQLEGSTLTEKETEILFELGFTANKKPMLHHLMNTDLKLAYDFALEQAKIKTKITPEFLKGLNSLVMRQTGAEHNGILGTWNEKKGDFRLHGVRAGIDGRSYVNFQKVPALIDQFCKETNELIDKVETVKDIYTLSFDAHYNLVTIHPWSDGNGRTARLLMNYLQFYHDIFPTKIHSNDKEKYISMLEKTRETESIEPIRSFLINQQIKTFQEEIKNFEKGKEDDFYLSL